jgi:hypothetical protein
LRANRIAYDLSLLTRSLGDGKGGLNQNGTLQRLVVSPELHDNVNDLAKSAKALLSGFTPIMRNLTEFSRKVAADPSLIGKSALRQ